MRIASQNVAKRLAGSGREIIRKIVSHSPHVIALQEITLRQVDDWCGLLSEASYTNVVRAVGYSSKGGALLASKAPIRQVQLFTDPAHGARTASGVIDGVSIASVYFPTGRSEHGWSHFHDDLMSNPTTRDFILIGDFQMVVAENEISSGTFGRWQRDPSYTSIQAMLGHWRDAFRFIHGPDKIAYSHQHNSGAQWLNDHALVPPSMDIHGCSIDWSPIVEGLSDHATLLLEVTQSEANRAGPG